MSCSQYRESLSALLDGEPPALPAAAVEAHVAGCAACTTWYEAAARVTRLLRLAPAEPVPDRTASLLAQVEIPPAPARRRVGALTLLRVALAALGCVQAVLAWPGAMLGEDGMADGHVAHEVGAWNLALAVAFLTAASRPRSAGVLVAPVGVFVGVLAVAAAADVVAREIDDTRVVAHLLVAAGLGLLVAVTRLAEGRPGEPPAGGSRADEPVGTGSPRLTAVPGPVPPPLAPPAGGGSMRAGSAA